MTVYLAWDFGNENNFRIFGTTVGTLQVNLGTYMVNYITIITGMILVEPPEPPP